MLGAQCTDPAQCIAALLQNVQNNSPAISFVNVLRIFTREVLNKCRNLFIRESLDGRNLASPAAVKNFHPADLLKDNDRQTDHTLLAHKIFYISIN
jgi:hypothetical protein